MSSQVSSRNPFRTPAATPNPTGASASSSVPPYASVASAPPSYSDPPPDDDEPPETLPDLTPRISSARPSNLVAQNTGPSTSSFSSPPALPPRSSSSSLGPSLRSNGPSIDDDLPPSLSADDVIPEVAPPAYSVTPNVGGGELVVEQGPRRPFQRAPEPLLRFPTPQNQQEEQGRQQQLQPPQPQPPRFAPPPGPPGSAPARPQSQLSDFARDFYDAGTATPPPAEQQQPQQPRFAPPPGPPPPQRPRAASTSSGAGSTAPPSSDGRPTTTPTPGHPLLRNGKTLVYPETYLCPKCTFLTPSSTCRYPRLSPQMRKGQNTGYKNYDPSHPCRKCWDRFSKPFTSILASSPWGSQGSGAMSQSERGRTFQRPLPAFKPPQVQPPRVQAPPPQPMPGAYPQLSPPVMQSSTSRVAPIPLGSIPPPGATVVMPGDPRIGGRLCWRCGGRGVTPFLIFDEITCDTCMGIGRLMN